jgi:hypothetical protein
VSTISGDSGDVSSTIIEVGYECVSSFNIRPPYDFFRLLSADDVCMIQINLICVFQFNCGLCAYEVQKVNVNAAYELHWKASKFQGLILELYLD